MRFKVVSAKKVLAESDSYWNALAVVDKNRTKFKGVRIQYYTKDGFRDYPSEVYREGYAKR